jgi:beta-glucosidase
VDRIVAELGLEEKLGQLTQRYGRRSKTPGRLMDDSELERIRRGTVGAYLTVSGAAVLRDLQRVAVEESPHGIPLLFGADVIHGFRTVMPVPIALASSWDPDSVERAARVAAREATASGLHWTFSPMVDIARDPRWGRIVEGAGEDPYLGAAMAAAYVRGYQGGDLRAEDSMIACAKHFAGYGAPTGGRDYDSAELSERGLRDVYLPPFHAAVAQGARTLMAGFNDVAGVPSSASRWLLTDILRGEWGFSGFVVSDYQAIDELQSHGLAGSRADAGALALGAGLDMDMMSEIYAELEPSVRSGAVSIDAVDGAVRRVLAIKEELGLFDDPYARQDPEREARELLSVEHVRAAREIARRSVVLLRNDMGTLPLSKALRKLAVVGPFAADRSAPLGAWAAGGRPEDVVSAHAGIVAALPGARVSTAPGCAATGDDPSGIAEAVQLARAAQAVVLVVGEPGGNSGENRSFAELSLSGCQQRLWRQLAATGKPLVVVLETGRPLILGPLADTSTLLLAWHLGVQLGPALADVLFGDAAPGGKLPVTWPRAVGQIPIFYAHRNTGRPPSEDLAKDSSRYRDLAIGPLFAFGHGLSYANFEYSDLRIEPVGIGPGAKVGISLRVRNPGPRAGDDVIQLYVRDEVATIAQPVQQLRGFRRISLAAGQSVQLRFSLPASALGFTDADNRHALEPGRFEIMLGSSSSDIRLRGHFELTGPRTTGLAPVLGTPVELVH